MVEFNNNRSAAVDRPPVQERTRGSKTRVYIADDQVLVRRGLAAVIRDESDLELCGETSSFTTANGEVCELRPDVVIVELSIDGKRGIELIQGIKAFDSEIGIVVLSRLNENVHAVPALKAGASAYVTKEAPPATVIDAIRKARDGKMCVSDRVAGQLLDRVHANQGMRSFSPASSLSSREFQVFKLIGSGRSNREIADRLKISIKTVETHRAHIKEKASIRSGFELLQVSIRWLHKGLGAPC